MHVGKFAHRQEPLTLYTLPCVCGTCCAKAPGTRLLHSPIELIGLLECFQTCSRTGVLLTVAPTVIPDMQVPPFKVFLPSTRMVKGTKNLHYNSYIWPRAYVGRCSKTCSRIGVSLTVAPTAIPDMQVLPCKGLPPSIHMVKVCNNLHYNSYIWPHAYVGRYSKTSCAPLRWRGHPHDHPHGHPRCFTYVYRQGTQVSADSMQGPSARTGP